MCLRVALRVAQNEVGKVRVGRLHGAAKVEQLVGVADFARLDVFGIEQERGGDEELRGREERVYGEKDQLAREKRRAEKQLTEQGKQDKSETREKKATPPSHSLASNRIDARARAKLVLGQPSAGLLGLGDPLGRHQPAAAQVGGERFLRILELVEGNGTRTNCKMR